MFELGKQLKLIRAVYGIKQIELAEKTGISQIQLSQFENGKIALVDNDIEKIRQALAEFKVQPTITIQLSDKLALVA